MRRKGWILVLLLMFLPTPAAAQEDARRHMVLSLADGGFVGFKSETAWVTAANVSPATSAGARDLQGEFRAQAFIDEKNVIHRVLLDASGKYVFGYDLLIEGVPASKTFNIAVSPLDSQIEKSCWLAVRVVSPPTSPLCRNPPSRRFWTTEILSHSIYSLTKRQE